MLTIEEYITRRKKDFKIDEFDENKKTENATVLSQIVSEYFEEYLKENMNKIKKTSDQVNKYRKRIDHYSTEVQDYLVEVYSITGNAIQTSIENVLKQDKFLLIRNTDEEIDELSYKAVKFLENKLPYVKIESTRIEKLVREYIKRKTEVYKNDSIPIKYPEIINWINDAELKYDVSLLAFADNLAEKFSNEEESWPHKRKTIDERFERLNRTYYSYDYKSEGNRFNLDELYEEIPEKSLLKNRKSYLEVLVMYYWLHSIDSDEVYWHEYLNQVSL